MPTLTRILLSISLGLLILGLSACAPKRIDSATISDTSTIEVQVFTATWCHNCHAVPAMLEKLRVEFPNVKFRELDADDGKNAKLMAKYDADAVPYFVVLADGKVADRVRGMMDYDEYVAHLRKLLSKR